MALLVWGRFLVILSALGFISLVVASSKTRNGDVPPGKPTGLTAVDLEPSARGVVLTLQWNSPPGNTTLTYYVSYSEDGKMTVQKRAYINRTTLELNPRTWYTIRVMALNQYNHQGPWSDPMRLWSNDSVPSMSPLNVTAISKDTSSIYVSWLPIPLQHHHGKLQGYGVFYRKSETRRWKRKKVTVGTSGVRITGLMSGGKYIIAVAGFTQRGQGKKSDPVSVVVEGIAVPATTVKQTTPPTTAYRTTTTWHTSTSSEPPSLVTPGLHDESTVLAQITPIALTITTLTSDVDSNEPSEKKEMSGYLNLVLKFIVPAAGGGLILVLLIVCLLWRRRRSRQKFKRRTDGEAIGLEALVNRKKGAKNKCKNVVTRGEGSIRYAPPLQTHQTSPATPCQDDISLTCNRVSDVENMLSTVPELTADDVGNTSCGMPGGNNPIFIASPEGDRSVGRPTLEDERYVKRSDPSRIYAVPFAHPRSPKNDKKLPRNAGYENMQHLYETLDLKNSDGSPLYMNVNPLPEDKEREGERGEGDDLYEEIPADQEDGEDEEECEHVEHEEHENHDEPLSGESRNSLTVHPQLHCTMRNEQSE